MAPIWKVSTFLLASLIGFAATQNRVSAQDAASARPPVAVTVEQSRDVTDPAANDFLRLIFVPPGASVTSLGLNRLRVFMAATSFFTVNKSHHGISEPFLPVSAVVNLTGGNYSPTNDLAAMRCQLPDPAQSAFIASWPNVIAAIKVDLTGYQCHPLPSQPTAENLIYCLAHTYHDLPDLVTVAPLAKAVVTGFGMMELSDSTGRRGADVLGSLYGIGLGFSGLGFSVAGSLNTALDATQSLQQSVATEYLVENATLKEAGCHCIQVPAYAGRDAEPLDPDYITRKGRIHSDGKCVMVPKLRTVLD